MRSRIWRWFQILGSITLLTAAFSYWAYASITDQYIAAAFGEQLRVEAVTPSAVAHAFKAKYSDSRSATIEDQLARLALQSFKGRMLHHHVLAILTAQRLGQRYSNARLLALYADNVYLGEADGRPLQGIAQGAAIYLGKNPESLSNAEAAWLVTLAERPRFLRAHPDKALEKRNQLIDRMVEADLIPANDAALAKSQPVPPLR